MKLLHSDEAQRLIIINTLIFLLYTFLSFSLAGIWSIYEGNYFLHIGTWSAGVFGVWVALQILTSLIWLIVIVSIFDKDKQEEY